jgi:hypothetical protein
MGSVNSYRRYAAQCLALSKTASADRELLVTMAQRWLELAERTHELHWPDKAERQSEDPRRH